jgi:hypothetical protein
MPGLLLTPIAYLEAPGYQNCRHDRNWTGGLIASISPTFFMSDI